MAEPQKRSMPQASTVSECSATDCAHNEDRECHAGEIVVRMEGGTATCGTYNPGTPRTRP